MPAEDPPESLRRLRAQLAELSADESERSDELERLAIALSQFRQEPVSFDQDALWTKIEREISDESESKAELGECRG